MEEKNNKMLKNSLLSFEWDLKIFNLSHSFMSLVGLKFWASRIMEFSLH
jgi:hypothetical protein